MDAASSYSSSKVTVEYHDPAGVFPLLSAQLQARLPLRNLHWKSHARPLRSINSLHVELVPGEDGLVRPSTAASQESLASHEGQRNSSTIEAVANRPSSGLQHFRSAVKERRHQIPGLRRTPYLKLYLLRCDDSETYKSTTRKEVRDWIRSNTPPTENKSRTAQEKHDAFEWLILHVVVPNTQAAAQPRFSGSASSSTGAAKDRSNSTRWPGGKSTTIFEKVRSDFNSTTAHSLDRVAQIRIQAVEPVAGEQDAETITIIPSWQETNQERENAWADMVSKLKTLILNSFDQRVLQYEDDIREKDAQRVLPGWNFCTFFVLKEGLARSFEGVGLVQDAIAIYDQLANGLEDVIQDKAAGRSETDATTFLDSTPELSKLCQASVSPESSRQALESFLAHPIDERSKAYRDMIVSSSISVFDFASYVFARQIALLLRLGKPTFAALVAPTLPNGEIEERNSFDELSLRRSSEQPIEENFAALAAVCRRTLSFLSRYSRAAKADLSLGLTDAAPPVSGDAIDGFVTSWSFAVVDQILRETMARRLEPSGPRRLGVPIVASTLKPSQPKITTATENPSTNTDHTTRPARSSSLANRESVVQEAMVNHPGYQPGDESMGPIELYTHFGFADLCSTRARLHLFQRNILVRLGTEKGYVLSLSAVLKGSQMAVSDPEDAEEEFFDSAATVSELSTAQYGPSCSSLGICHHGLRDALSSTVAFIKAYNSFTSSALSFQVPAGLFRSMEKSVSDLAIAKYSAGDFDGAAPIFSRMTAEFSQTDWNRLEVAMLVLHSRCLKALNRRDDCVRALLQILTKTAARYRGTRTNTLGASATQGTPSVVAIMPSWLNDEYVEVPAILHELLDYSAELPYQVAAPMSAAFTDIEVDSEICNNEDRDGFSLGLQLRWLLPESFTADAVQLRLVATSAEQKSDIILENTTPVVVQQGVLNYRLNSKTTAYGTYMVEKITLRAQQICFIHEPLSKNNQSSPLRFSGAARVEAEELAKRAQILCYPRIDSFRATMRAARDIHIDGPRSIELDLLPGSQEVSTIEVCLRAGSAGLRLQCSESSVTSGSATVSTQGFPPGTIRIDSIKESTLLRLDIPYTLDSQAEHILVRLDITYIVNGKSYNFTSQETVQIDLPIDVNVQDNFTPSALFSTFNVRTTDKIPILLRSASLSNTPCLTVSGPLGGRWPRFVLPQRGVSVQFIVKQERGAGQNLKDPLSLDIEYQRLDEQVKAVAEVIMSRELVQDGLQKFSGLIVPVFKERLSQHIPAADYAAIAVRDEVTLPTFQNFGWDQALDAIPRDQRTSVEVWLATFHERHVRILLGNIDVWPGVTSADEQSDWLKPFEVPETYRRIKIPVTIPTMHIVSVTKLAVENYSRKYDATDAVWKIGQSRKAALSMSHTRRWASPLDVQHAAELEAPDDELLFSYEVEANPDIWAVGGPTKGTFSQRAGSEATLELQFALVPLRQGDWELPSVDMRPVQPDHRGATEQTHRRGSVTTADGTVDGEQAIVSECCCESAFQRALVVSDVKSVTVGLMNGGSTVLLDTINKADV